MLTPKICNSFMAFLIRDTNTDQIIWRHVMGNMHEAIVSGKKIVTDWERDEAPWITIDDSELQVRGLGIEELRKSIDTQYHRRKAYYGSDDPKAAAALLRYKQILEQGKNYRALEEKINYIFINVLMICRHCYEPLLEKTKKIARAFGVEKVLCRKCRSSENR